MGLDIRDCDCTGYKRGELGQLKNINFLLLNQGLMSAPDPSLHYLEVSGTPDVPPRMCQSVFEATHIPTLFYRIYCIVDFNMEKVQTCGPFCIQSCLVNPTLLGVTKICLDYKISGLKDKISMQSIQSVPHNLCLD